MPKRRGTIRNRAKSVESLDQNGLEYELSPPH